MRFYKLPPQKVIILSDDVSLDVGVIRVRRKGSDGGQKGLQNIIYLSGSDEFPRVKIGVGKKPHPEYELKDWVLSRFTEMDKKRIVKRLPDIKGAVECIVAGNIDQAMNLYN